MRTPRRKPDREDIARRSDANDTFSASASRYWQQLNWLFGKRPPEKDKSPGEGAFIGAAEIKLPANHTKNPGGAHG